MGATVRSYRLCTGTGRSELLALLCCALLLWLYISMCYIDTASCGHCGHYSIKLLCAALCALLISSSFYVLITQARHAHDHDENGCAVLYIATITVLIYIATCYFCYYLISFSFIKFLSLNLILTFLAFICTRLVYSYSLLLVVAPASTVSTTTSIPVRT